MQHGQAPEIGHQTARSSQHLPGVLASLGRGGAPLPHLMQQAVQLHERLVARA
jgi:hypothetical protein